MKKILLATVIFCLIGNAAFAVKASKCEDQPWFMEKMKISGTGATEDELAICHVFEKYTSTLEEGDGEGWISLWDTDGVQMPPEAPMRIGKPAIWNAGKADFEEIEIKMWREVQEIVVFGQLGYARGVYGYTGHAKNSGPSFSFDGKFITMLRKQMDGRWLIYRDIFNSNLPVK